MNFAYRIHVEGADAPMFVYDTEQALRIVNNLIKEGKGFNLRAIVQ